MYFQDKYLKIKIVLKNFFFSFVADVDEYYYLFAIVFQLYPKIT